MRFFSTARVFLCEGESAGCLARRTELSFMYEFISQKNDNCRTVNSKSEQQLVGGNTEANYQYCETRTQEHAEDSS